MQADLYRTHYILIDVATKNLNKHFFIFAILASEPNIARRRRMFYFVLLLFLLKSLNFLNIEKIKSEKNRKFIN